MECVICCEKYYYPKSQEELSERLHQAIDGLPNGGPIWYSAIEKFKALLITQKHNTIHQCYNPKCGCLTCDYCWSRYVNNGKEQNNKTVDDMPGIYDTFKCPYCREIDWKFYYGNVLQELEKTVLGMDEWRKMFLEKCNKVI